MCTANVCRSALAAGLLKLRATQAGAPISVASAGILAEGMKSDPHVVSVLSEYGVDGSSKRSRLLDREILAGADLILPMTMSHARRAIGELPAARERVFLLREVVQLSSTVGPRPDDMPLDKWLRLLDGARTLNYAEEDAAFEVPDPIGEPREVFVELAKELDQNLSWFITLANLGRVIA